MTDPRSSLDEQFAKLDERIRRLQKFLPPDPPAEPIAWVRFEVNQSKAPASAPSQSRAYWAVFILGLITCPLGWFLLAWQRSLRPQSPWLVGVGTLLCFGGLIALVVAQSSLRRKATFKSKSTEQASMPPVDTTLPFGARLYLELRRLSGFDVITETLDYGPIQKLKQTNREETIALFRRDSELLHHALRTAEPEDVARMIIEDFNRECELRRRHPAGFTSLLLLGLITGEPR